MSNKNQKSAIIRIKNNMVILKSKRLKAFKKIK